MLTEITTVFGSLTALVAGLLGVFKYFNYRNRRDKIQLVRESFDGVVSSLASSVTIERNAAAILLRRFFDPRTEVGIAGTPYWQEALDVTAATLRGLDTSDFQKVLADGLGHAPTLRRADLQKTNLQYAYLGSRKTREDDTEVRPDLSYADFYRADLSRASLKGALAFGAVFYQARLHGAIFNRADLRQANFFEADLKGARFDQALLEGASFANARNVPEDLLGMLDGDRVYPHADPFSPGKRASSGAEARVFISKPGYLDYGQQQQVSAFLQMLAAEGITPQMLDRPDYPRFGVIGEVQRLICDCVGGVVFGYSQLTVREGVWRAGTPEEKQIRDVGLSTPWNNIEAGMAVMQGLPLLILSQKGVDGGIFDVADGDQIYHAGVDEDWRAPRFRSSFSTWCADVHERSRR